MPDKLIKDFTCFKHSKNCVSVSPFSMRYSTAPNSSKSGVSMSTIAMSVLSGNRGPPHKTVIPYSFAIQKLPAMPGIQKSFRCEQKYRLNLTRNPADCNFKATVASSMKRKDFARGSSPLPHRTPFRTSLLSIFGLLPVREGQGVRSAVASVRKPKRLKVQTVKQGFARIGRTPGFAGGNDCNYH